MDDLGNRDVVAVRSGDDEDYIIDANTNRYASIDSNSLTHDPAGNLTKDKDGGVFQNCIIEEKLIHGFKQWQSGFFYGR